MYYTTLVFIVVQIIATLRRVNQPEVMADKCPNPPMHDIGTLMNPTPPPPPLTKTLPRVIITYHMNSQLEYKINDVPQL